MKNFLFTVLTCVIASFSMISCDNETNNLLSVNDNLKSKLPQLEDSQSIFFIYHGKIYESDYFITDDTLINYINPEVNELAAKFEQMPNLYIFCYPNGEKEYFNSRQEFTKQIKRVMQTVDNIYKTAAQSRSSHIDGGLPSGVIQIAPVSPDYHRAELLLYDDTFFCGRCELLPIENMSAILQIPHLKNKYNMNDKTSSMIAYSINTDALFECYEDDNYRNHCLSFIVRKGQRCNYTSTPGSSENRIENNGKYYGEAWFDDLHTCDVVGTKRSSWNDRITSVIMSAGFIYPDL